LKSRKIIVYGARNLPAFDFVNGETSILLYDPKVRDNVYFEENHQATCFGMGIKKNVRIMLMSRNNNVPGISFYDCLYKKGNFVQFYDKRVCFLSKKLPKTASRKIHLDYLVITGNPQVTIEQIQRIFEADEIIVDPSNSRWRSNGWKEEAAKMGVKIRLVNETGAYVIELGY
jgi:hypothetical protein